MRARLAIWVMMAGVGVLPAQQRHVGLVEPIRDVWMGTSASGRVAVLHAGEGDVVQEGEPILSLDDRIERLEVERRRMIREDESELLAARERVALLAEDLASTRDLFETTASVSREEVRRKEVEHRLAEIDVKRLERAEERERAELAMAEARLALNHITAPFTGILAEVRLDEGESVQAGQEVLRLVDVSEAYLVLNIPADLAALLEVGQAVKLHFGVGTPVHKTGQVAFISPVVDASSGLRTVKMRFRNQAPRVEPGRTGTWVQEDVPHE